MEEPSPDYYLEVLSSVQENFNDLCEKLKSLQSEFEQVQNQFQLQMSQVSPGKEVLISPRTPQMQSHFASQSRFGHSTPLVTSQFNNNFTPRDSNLKQEIMNECLTFCQNQIQHIAQSQRGAGG